MRLLALELSKPNSLELTPGRTEPRRYDTCGAPLTMRPDTYASSPRGKEQRSSTVLTSRPRSLISASTISPGWGSVWVIAPTPPGVPADQVARCRYPESPICGMLVAGRPRHNPHRAREDSLDRSPNGPPQGLSLRDRLIACLWWLIFMGGVAGGTATGVVLALWLLLSPLPGLLLIVACWLCGNVAGWRFAARLDPVAARQDRTKVRRIHARWYPYAVQFRQSRVAPTTRAVGLTATAMLRLQSRVWNLCTAQG